MKWPQLFPLNNGHQLFYVTENAKPYNNCLKHNTYYPFEAIWVFHFRMLVNHCYIGLIYDHNGDLDRLHWIHDKLLISLKLVKFMNLSIWIDVINWLASLAKFSIKFVQQLYDTIINGIQYLSFLIRFTPSIVTR